MDGPGEEVTQRPSVTSSCPELPAGLGFAGMGFAGMGFAAPLGMGKGAQSVPESPPHSFLGFSVGIPGKVVLEKPQCPPMPGEGTRERGGTKLFPFPPGFFPFQLKFFPPLPFLVPPKQISS